LVILVISSTAEINIYGGELKHLAESTFKSFDREFHYELAVVRWCFIGCAFSLLNGVVCRLLLEYNMTHEGKYNEGNVLFAFMISVLSGFLSYTNSDGMASPWKNWTLIGQVSFFISLVVSMMARLISFAPQKTIFREDFNLIPNNTYALVEREFEFERTCRQTCFFIFIMLQFIGLTIHMVSANGFFDHDKKLNIWC
jgi:hypothetical protein